MEFIIDGIPKDRQVLIDTISITYNQENDCTEVDEGVQVLTLETRDGGGGKFIHLKSEGWSFDSIEELIAIIEDFKSRIKIINEENSNNS